MALWGLAAVVAVALSGCEPCQPWKDNACSIGDDIDVRFGVGALPGMCGQGDPDENCGTNAFPDPAKCTEGAAKGCTGYKTHFYCAETDQFSSFTLKSSYDYLTKGSGKDADIAMYGSGKFGVPRMPSVNMSSRVPVYVASHDGCANGSAAIASFLVYNITLNDGKYKYKNNDPIGNGFINTCDDGKCAFDSDSVCIQGPTGSSNCGKCVGGEPDGEDVKVLISYYGTGSDGKVMLSGSSNPLNFRAFAVTDVATDIGKSVTKKFSSLTP